MKYLFRVLILVLAISIPTLAISSPEIQPKPTETTDEDEKIQSICPVTLIKDNNRCMDCHEVRRLDGELKWVVKEDKWRHTPYGLTIEKNCNGIESGYFKLFDISDDRVKEHLAYLRKNNIKKYTVEINSPGGSVVAAWRIIGLFRQYPEIEVTTICNGFAASAGFILLASGDNRIASPRAMLMIHELWSIAFLKVETPASSKDEAETMRLWQDNINDWLAERSKMSSEEIHERIHKKDWWMNGLEAHKKGFVDRLVW